MGILLDGCNGGCDCTTTSCYYSYTSPTAYSSNYHTVTDVRVAKHYASDGTAFFTQKEMFLHENRIHERALWKKRQKYKEPKPIIKCCRTTMIATNTAMSMRQRNQQKRKSYLHS